ncbi:MAG: hypothetical protein H0U31_04820, partial [Chloroflexia bacterium]|nr:hypothetical protein [Chloroflexia bacterium]
AKFENEYLEHLRTSQPELLERIKTEKTLADDLVESLKTVTENFLSANTYDAEAAAQVPEATEVKSTAEDAEVPEPAS